MMRNLAARSSLCEDDGRRAGASRTVSSGLIAAGGSGVQEENQSASAAIAADAHTSGICRGSLAQAMARPFGLSHCLTTV